MTFQDLLTIILSLGIPIFAGFGWLIIKFVSLEKVVLESKVEILREIGMLDSRISHMEGYLIGRQQAIGDR